MPQKTTPLISQGWLRAMLFFIALVLANFAVYLFLFTNRGDEEMFPMIPGITVIIGIIGIAALITILLVYIFCRLVDKVPVSHLGLSFDTRGTFAGFFLAASLIGLGSLILVMSNALQWTDWNFNAKEFFTALGLMLLVAISEELAFRGYILTNLLQSFPRRIAIAVSACAFVFMHAANPGMQIIPVINLLLGGLLLGQCYTINRNIWMPIGFHFAWNFLQGSVVGFNVSGLQLTSVLQQHLEGSEWMTGGEFGFEGSIIASIVLLTGIIFLEIRLGILTGEGKLITSNS